MVGLGHRHLVLGSSVGHLHQINAAGVGHADTEVVVEADAGDRRLGVGLGHFGVVRVGIGVEGQGILVGFLGFGVGEHPIDLVVGRGIAQLSGGVARSLGKKRGQVQFSGWAAIWWRGRPGDRRVACRPSSSTVDALHNAPAIGRTALHAPPQGLQLGLGLRSIDVLAQIAGTRDRPRRKPSLLLRRSMLANPEASPPPIDRPLDQSGPQRVPLGVPQNLIKMAIRLNRKRLEPPLIDVAIAESSLGPHPTCGVRYREPLKEQAQLAIRIRPHDKMPMVGHQAITADPQRHFGQRFGQRLFECFVVARLAERPHPPHATIEDMVSKSTWSDTHGSGHRHSLICRLVSSMNWTCSRLSSVYPRLSSFLGRTIQKTAPPSTSSAIAASSLIAMAFAPGANTKGFIRRVTTHW